MDFEWTADHLRLRRAAEKFAAAELTAGAADRDREGVFSRESWEACARFGLQGLLIPPAWGGGGHDLLSAVAILEGIGRGARDNGLVFSVAAHAVSCAGPIVDHGTDAQKQQWLPRLADGSAIGAPAMTEPDSGSSALALGTTARPDADGWMLDGTKAFITNAPVADVFVVYARTGPGVGGITCFLVPRSTPGLQVGPPLEKMGLRTSLTSEVRFEGCQVPGAAVLGRVGSGAMVFSQVMDVERLLLMAPAVGVMDRLLARCTAHARERKAGGVPIGRHQSIAHRIADMELALESARLLLYRGAWRKMRRGTSTRESALAKLAVSEAYVASCRSAMQIFGGYGYMVEYEIERELRDALSATLYVGTSEIQRNLIAGLRGLG